MTSEEILAIFFVECEESLAAAEAGLVVYKAGTQNDDTINAVFRGVHSIKGGAGAFGFSTLQAYIHIFETLLSDVREELVPLTPALIDLLLSALDTLADHITAARENTPAPEDAALPADLTAAQAANARAAPPPEPAPAPAPAPVAAAASADDEDELTSDFDLDAMLNDLAGGGSAEYGESGAQDDEAPGWQVHLRPRAGAMRNGGEPLLLLRELTALGARCQLCDTSAVPPLDELDPCQGYLGWTFTVPGDIAEDQVRDIFDFVGDDCPITVGAQASIPPADIDAPAPRAAPVAARPVAAAVASARAAAPAAGTPPAAPAPGQSIRIDLIKLDKLIDTVGELVIAQAMLAQRLSSDGIAATEELGLLEGLTRDIHESAMAIRAQPIGSVFSRVPRILRELSASTGKHVKLAVAGETTELDKTVIERLGEPLTHLIRNAVDHGIEPAEERLAAGKSAEGTLSLSAKHRSGRILIRIADDGRGAGMDVVRQNVKDLGGRITIDSEEGKGTTFTLTLPLTLAISDGMIVKVGDQTLVVPLTHVVESLRPKPCDVQGMGAQQRMLNVRGRFIPVVPVADAVGAIGARDRPEHGVLIVVDTEAAGQAALLVDNIWDQRQFVIKSLDTHYRSVEGVAGATILGDGRVALILNVDTLVSSAVAAGLRKEAA